MVGLTYHGLPGPAHKAHGNMAAPPPLPDSSSSRSGHGSLADQSGFLASQHLSTASHSAYSFGLFGDSGFIDNDDDDSSQDDD